MMMVYNEERLSYKGFISWILIANANSSYLIDALTLRNHMGSLGNVILSVSNLDFIKLKHHKANLRLVPCLCLPQEGLWNIHGQYLQLGMPWSRVRVACRNGLHWAGGVRRRVERKPRNDRSKANQAKTITNNKSKLKTSIGVQLEDATQATGCISRIDVLWDAAVPISRV